MPTPSNVVTPLGDAPNSPALTTDSQQHVPALTDIGQALQLVRSLQAENREREKKNSRILERYNAERPFNPHQLKADGLSWKTNFTTKPLTTLIDKVVPRFITAVRNMKYLTASELPDRFDNATEKSEKFRAEITKTCRAHELWDQFVTDIAQENTLFGYVCGAWLDKYSWFPRYYDQDSFLVPQGTRHSPKTATVICVRDSYLVHQLFDMIRDFQAAQTAGWSLVNVVEAINNAVPDDRRSYQTDYSRVYADLVRESAILSSFTGAKAVICWHVFVQEVDGHVTHVAFDDRSGKQLFWANKQFERMSDVAAFFTFQHGNGRIHGSKGIGRELYNMAVVLDRARNEVVDRLQLSGKLLLQCEEREIKRFRMSVIGNAILVGSGYTINQNKLDSNVDAFFALDRFLTALLDQIAGNVSPNVSPASPGGDQPERVTKAQVDLQASREGETRDSLIERFLVHFSRFMSTIQRRLCSEFVEEQDAKEMQARLLKIMSREELDYLANQPAVAAIQDLSDRDRQSILLLGQQVRGNPLYNQVELEKAICTAAMNAEFATKVILPVNDPTEQAENVREQMMENISLQNGQEIPVSPRDNHVVHLDVLHNSITALIPLAPGNVKIWHVMELLAAHGQEHLVEAEKHGMQKQVLPYRTFLTKVASTLIKLHQTRPGFPGGPAVPPGGPIPAQPGAGVSPGTAGSPATQAEAAAANQSGGPPPTESAPAKVPIHEAMTIAYKDLPEDVKRQVEEQIGLTPSRLPPPPNSNAPAPAPSSGAPSP